MAKKLLDYDSYTKTSTWFEGGGDGSFKVHQSQDIESILRYTKALANNQQYKREGIKNDAYHFARVPNSILHEMLVKHGVNWMVNEDMPKIERLLQTEYKHFLTVDKI